MIGLEGLSKYYDGEHLFSNVSTSIKTGMRIGLVGKNGSGKTTLLKILLGKDTIIDGNGSTGGITISDGLIDMRTGTGSVSKIKFYCESSNAHFQTLQAAPHSASASNTLVLPSAGSNLISDTATQTLTNKTLTSPDINTPDIDGGAIDGAVIGANTRAAASVTTLNANSTVTGQSFTDGTATLSSGGLTGLTNISVDNINANGNTV